MKTLTIKIHSSGQTFKRPCDEEGMQEIANTIAGANHPQPTLEQKLLRMGYNAILKRGEPVFERGIEYKWCDE